jgi:hypothetical protein
MQTHWQTTLEVLVDFACSVLVNVAGQWLFYRAAATAERMTLFAGFVLGLAVARRFVTRRCFEALIPSGTRQPQWQSVVESVTDTIVGFAVAVLLQMLIYGEVATLLRASGLTVLVYSLAMLRRYLLRRVFAAWALRAA